jgi:hypothetical protein
MWLMVVHVATHQPVVCLALAATQSNVLLK